MINRTLAAILVEHLEEWPQDGTKCIAQDDDGNVWGGILHDSKYSKKWDAELIALMDTHSPLEVEMDDYVIEFPNGKDVWIANKYYAYGYDWSSTDFERTRPSVRTMCRLALFEAKARK